MIRILGIKVHRCTLYVVKSNKENDKVARQYQVISDMIDGLGLYMSEP